jgi:hypothetical protein
VLQLSAQPGTSAAGTGSTAVQVTTVDDMMDKLRLQHLFLLKIDTEGFDILVLEGARKALTAHKIDVVLFEYHGIGLWGTAPAYTLKVSTADSCSACVAELKHQCCLCLRKHHCC